MNDDPTLLSSRYLDGDVSAVERALVEADPELLAEVDRMRAVRDAIAGVPPPGEDQRNAAIAAALAAFAAPEQPPVASLAARRRARWLLPVAAAIVGILAFGGLAALFANTSGDDDDDAASEAEILSEAADATAVDDAGIAGGGDTADESMLAAPPDTGAAETATAGQAAAVTSVADTEGTSGAPRASAEAFEQLATPDELLQFATREATGDTSSGAVSATTAGDGTNLRSVAETCNLGQLIGAAIYTTEGRDEFVIVVVDADEALAVTPTCAIVARVPLP